MSPSEAPNPEHRSNNALLCFCIGLGCCIGAYVLGVGAMLGAVFSGGNATVVVGGVVAALGLALLAICGFILTAIGGIWMVVRVIADQTGDADEKRYRNIER